MSILREMDFTVERIRNKEERTYPGLSVLFVAEGTLQAVNSHESIYLKERGILSLMPGMRYELSSETGAVAAIAAYSPQLLSAVMHGEVVFITLNSSTDQTHSYRDLRNIFYELMRSYIRGQDESGCLNESLLLKLLDCMLRHYRTAFDAAALSASQEDVRTRKIVQYVMEHFREELNLASLAQEMYVSTSTLSRSFHKNTGTYFADYVARVRAGYAARQLIQSDASLTRIALESGFSNPAIFSKTFKGIYGCSPKEYREEGQKNKTERDAQKAGEEEALRAELSQRSDYHLQPGEVCPVVFSAEDEGRKFKKSWNRAINIGSAYDLTRANIQYHVIYLKEHLHLTHIRFWNLFSEKLMLMDETQPGRYNFDPLDQIFDFLTENGLKPFIDMGPRPEAVLRSGIDTVRFQSEYLRNQKKEDWQRLMNEFVRHLTRRYGAEALRDWCFEFTRDSIHEEQGVLRYYQDPAYDFREVWRYARGLLRSRMPEARIGGIGSIIYQDWEYTKKFLNWCREEELEPDFLTSVIFPYMPQVLPDGKIGKELMQRPGSEKEQLQQYQSLRKEAGLDHVPIIISEVNSSLSARNQLNDSCFRGAYFAKLISQIFTDAEMMIPLTGSDWVNTHPDFHGVVDGGLGFLTKDCIEKPVMTVMSLADHMGDELIERAENAIVTRKSRGDFYILAFNFKWFSSQYFMQEEDEPIRLSESDLFEDTEPLSLKISLKDAQDGEYCIKMRLVQEEGSVIGEWEKLGFDENLTGRDIRYLRDCCYPRMTIRRKMAEKGRMETEIILQPHEVALIHIFRDGSDAD